MWLYTEGDLDRSPHRITLCKDEVEGQDDASEIQEMPGISR